MDRDDIIRMAREATTTHEGWCDRRGMTYHEYFDKEKFAALVAAAEREACAEMCDDMVLYTGYDCAASIRARGQA